MVVLLFRFLLLSNLLTGFKGLKVDPERQGKIKLLQCKCLEQGGNVKHRFRNTANIPVWLPLLPSCDA